MSVVVGITAIDLGHRLGEGLKLAGAAWALALGLESSGADIAVSDLAETSALHDANGRRCIRECPDSPTEAHVGSDGFHAQSYVCWRQGVRRMCVGDRVCDVNVDSCVA